MMHMMATAEQPERGRSRRRVTVEAVIWVALALVALVMRVANLEASPLSQSEAREALGAWRAIAIGQETPPDASTQAQSPVLLVANALLFALAGASDANARILPALFGTGLVLSPWLLRPRIGRTGSLAAGAYIAISPTALIASRQTDGAVLAAAGAMVALGGLVQFVETTRDRWMVVAAVGLALSMCASPLAYASLVPLGLAGAVTVWRSGAGRLSALWNRLRPSLAIKGLPAFAVALIVLSTGAGWRGTGLARAAILLPTWLSGFGSGTARAAAPATIFLAYELLILVVGIGGFIWGIGRGGRLMELLGIWAGIGLASLWIRPSAPPLEALGPVLPLALLAGTGTHALIARLSKRDAVLIVRLMVPVSLVMWAYTYIVLAHYAKTGHSTDLLLALLALGIQLLLIIASAFAIQTNAALAGFAAASAVALALVTFSLGWGAAHAHPTSPQVILLDRPTDDAVRDLLSSLEGISWRSTGVPTRVVLTYESHPDSVLAWYLRGFPFANRVDVGNLGEHRPETPHDVVIAASLESVPPDEGYTIGQDFAIHRRWHIDQVACVRAESIDCRNAVRWLLFRTTEHLPEADEQAVLWLREAVASDALTPPVGTD